MELANKYKLFVVEDAAQAIDSFYITSNGEKKALGSIGHFAAFSFHETKNIISGEGGMLVINDKNYESRAEIIWEKGTNRSSFFRGEIDKYGWVDLGSSFLPSEITAAFLWAQIENIEKIQTRRLEIWNEYYSNLKDWAEINTVQLPNIPLYATNNAHMFYLICPNLDFRNNLIDKLKQNNILAVFHYQSLHKSPFYLKNHDGRVLVNSDFLTDTLVRLPMFYELDIQSVLDSFKNAANI
jgi:dTDP-4-amino-4,6-dideoxygalactose transaminase